MNIRFLIAQEIAEHIGAELVNLRCERCQFPMMAKREQGMLPFCWGCVTDKRTAAQGRHLLLKAKLVAQGIMVQEPESLGYLEGMPL